MSLHVAKFLKNPLVLASAAIVIHIGAATAADIQQQMQEVLVGTPSAHSAPHSALRDRNVTSASADAQESVKQVLLGTISPRVERAETITKSELAVDLQSAVRQILLGQRHASDAS